MKSWCGTQQLAKCNFCLEWYDITSQHYTALTNLYVCPGCFDRCRKSSHFRVVQPKTMNVYEVLFKKCPAQQLEMIKGQSNQLLQLADLYEQNNLDSNKVQTFRNFISQLVSYENEVLNKIEPVREFINRIYRTELNRVERIWQDVVQEVENIGVQIAQFRKSATDNLRKQGADVQSVQNGLTDIKQKVSQKIQSYDLEHIQEMYKDQPTQFFKNGFKINPESSQELLSQKSNKISLLRLNSKDSQYFFSNDVNNHRRQPSILKFKQKKLNTNFKSNEKQNVPEVRRQRSISPFLRSPRQSKLKNLFKGNRLDTQSIDITNQVEDQRKESLKNQIKQFLKNKPTLPSYRPNEQKIQSKLLYVDMIMKQTVFQALEMTFIGNNMIELIAYNTQQLDFQCYLQMLKWNPQLQIIKFVKIGLTDDNLNMLMNYIKKAEKIQSLVVTNNLLTDGCFDILWKYFRTQRPIKNIYLGRNYIQPLKCRQRINDLRSLNVNVFI